MAEARELATGLSEQRTFQMAGRASAKAQRQEHAWHVCLRTSREVSELEPSRQNTADDEVREAMGGADL